MIVLYIAAKIYKRRGKKAFGKQKIIKNIKRTLTDVIN